MLAGQLLERGTGISDGDEVFSRIDAFDSAHAGVEVFEKRNCLRRATGLARDNENGIRQVNRGFDA